MSLQSTQWCVSILRTESSNPLHRYSTIYSAFPQFPGDADPTARCDDPDGAANTVESFVIQSAPLCWRLATLLHRLLRRRLAHIVPRHTSHGSKWFARFSLEESLDTVSQAELLNIFQSTINTTQSFADRVKALLRQRHRSRISTLEPQIRATFERALADATQCLREDEALTACFRRRAGVGRAEATGWACPADVPVVDGCDTPCTCDLQIIF